MYPVPRKLLQTGRPYPALLRYLAEHGYYGEGDVEALVARRVESLRNPTRQHVRGPFPGRPRLPHLSPAGDAGRHGNGDHRHHRASSTPKSDLARKEAELHVALDNMPGALAYTDHELNIVVCNDRFAELYPVPTELLQPGRPYPDLLRYLAETRLLRRRRRRRAGRAACREPAQSDGSDVRGPHARRTLLSYRAAARPSSGGTVTVMTDITELKHAEQELLEAKQRAEDASRQRHREEPDARVALVEAVEVPVAATLQSIFSGEKNVEVASQRKKLTIFFSDIAGFTETTDMLESEELTTSSTSTCARCRRSRSSMARPSTSSSATPSCCSSAIPRRSGAREDAIACVTMAIAMQQRMRDLQAEWRERGQEHVFQLRIGINTGFCTVGNFGSDDRVDYTVIGNEVNLASRLQTARRPRRHPARARDLRAGQGQRAYRGNRHHHGQGLSEAREDLSRRRPAPRRRPQGRVIRQEQDGLLLIIDQQKLTGQARADAIKVLQDTLGRLAE